MPALVCFTMDNLGDAADLQRGIIQSPRKPGERPAFEVGFPALLDLYQRFNIRITHFVEGWSAEQYPEEINRVLSLGHEVGMHGWQHELWSDLGHDQVSELAQRATNAIARVGGVSPTSFRAPGGHRTEACTDILEALGYLIDASLSPSRQDGGPVRQLSGNLWTAPYTWQGVDATHWLWQKESNEQAESLWKANLEQHAADDSHMIFIWHPHIMGIDPGRLAVGERILQFVSDSPDYRIVTLPELVTHYQQQDNAT